jgi:DNA primase
MRALLERAVPLARFEVERALETGDTSSAEGRDRVLDAVRVALSPLGPSVLRDELVQLVAGRLSLSESLVSQALSREGRRPTPSRGAPLPGAGGAAPRGAGGANGARDALDRREQTERAFLAYCLALPDLGEQRLADPASAELFTAPTTRRAAEYLRGRLRAPAGDLPPDDEPLARLVAELVIRAGELEATPAKLELEGLQLDLARLDRLIAGARVAGVEQLHDLAAERQRVLDEIRHKLT